MTSSTNTSSVGTSGCRFQSITDLTSTEDNPSAQKYEPEEDDLIIPELQRQTGEKPVQISPQAVHRDTPLHFFVPQKLVVTQANVVKTVIKDESLRDFFEQLVKIQEQAFPPDEDRIDPNGGRHHVDIHHVFGHEEIFSQFKARTYPRETLAQNDPLRQLGKYNGIRLWIDTSWKALFDAEPCEKYEMARKTTMNALDELTQACFKETRQEVQPRCIKVLKALSPLLSNDSEDPQSMGLCDELDGYLERMHRYLPVKKYITPATLQHTNPQAKEVVFPHPFYAPKQQGEDPEEFELPKTITIDKSSANSQAEFLSMAKFFADYAEFQYLHCCFLKNLISPMVKVIGVIKGYPGPYEFLDDKRPPINQLLLRAPDADKSGKENKDNKQNGEG